VTEKVKTTDVWPILCDLEAATQEGEVKKMFVEGLPVRQVQEMVGRRLGRWWDWDLVLV